MAEIRRIDEFHRRIYRHLSTDLANRAEQVSYGSVSTMEEYRYQIGFMQALRDTIEACIEIEKEMYSGGKEESEV